MATLCLKQWKDNDKEDDYRIEIAERKWLGNSQKRFCCAICTTQEITDYNRCSVTKSLA